MSEIRLHNTVIREDGRLGAALFYAYWTKRTDMGKGMDAVKTFAGIYYGEYDLMCVVNNKRATCPRGS